MLGGTGQGKTSLLNFFANAERVLENLKGLKKCQEINDPL